MKTTFRGYARNDVNGRTDGRFCAAGGPVAAGGASRWGGWQPLACSSELQRLLSRRAAQEQISALGRRAAALGAEARVFTVKTPQWTPKVGTSSAFQLSFSWAEWNKDEWIVTNNII